MTGLADLLTVSEAARLLDVSPPRVYALVESGALRSFRRGNQYLIHALEVEARRAQGVTNGRPLDQTSAWAVLWLALARDIGILGPWGAHLSRNTRWRIRQKLADGPLSRTLMALAPRLRHRGHLMRLQAHPSDVARIAEEPDLVRTGVSAAAEVGADIVAPGVVEAYVPGGRIAKLRTRYLLEDSWTPNVLLRAVHDPWPFPPDTRVAPATAVALDLLDSSDERTRRAGRELLRALEQQAHP